MSVINPKHSFLLHLIAFLFSGATQAQLLYTPRDVQKAFKNQTRSTDGKPGKNYWQNHGNYDISVSLNPPDRNFTGQETISYSNASPDTLRNLVIKLILNIHRPGAVRFGDAGPAYLTKGTIIDEVQVNGQPVRWIDPNSHVTWQALRLPSLLLPHDSLQLKIKWHAELSQQSNREGAIDSSTFFLAYFYPRVAVYDDYAGWDRMDFTDEQEFYNDFNNYKLHVTVPGQFIVWSTGDLLNPEKVLQPATKQKLQQSMTTDEVLHIATPQDLREKKVTIPNAQNTWDWQASNITDMTFGISDHFNWDASSVVVEPGRRASVQAAYNDTARDFHQMVEFGRHSLEWLSKNWPGVPYPFNKTTIFQGNADMEYPMMVNDATEEEPAFARFVVEHEIAHTWFPFYMGINETRYGFMDEGWATTFELLIGREDLGKEQAEEFYRQFRVNGWIGDKSADEDLPIITPANILRGSAYGNNAYGKPSLGYLAVKDMLGDAEFKKCLHAYMDRWHGKHPIPWDFFYTFNNVSGKNLNWFWQAWYFSNGYIDLAITKVTGNMLSVHNIGGLPVPFDVIARYADGSSDTTHHSSVVWQKNMSDVTVDLKTKKKISSIEIDGGIYVDADKTNNSWKAN